MSNSTALITNLGFSRPVLKDEILEIPENEQMVCFGKIQTESGGVYVLEKGTQIVILRASQ